MRLPANRIALVAPGEFLQHVDGLLEELAALGRLALVRERHGLVEEIDADLQLRLKTRLGQRLLLGLDLGDG